MSILTQTIEPPLRLLAEYKVECVIVGGIAAAIHGSSLLTNDVDVCYERDSGNLKRLAEALRSVNARLRNAPEGLPFILDAETLRRGLNFTFGTDIGDLDLLGEIRGVGVYKDVLEGSITVDLFGYQFAVIDIGKLIVAKRAAGRSKDLIALPELEAIQEAQSMMREAERPDDQ
jgi:predicted nucleotidyltransferase